MPGGRAASARASSRPSLPSTAPAPSGPPAPAERVVRPASPWLAAFAVSRRSGADRRGRRNTPRRRCSLAAHLPALDDARRADDAGQPRCPMVAALDRRRPAADDLCHGGVQGTGLRPADGHRPGDRTGDPGLERCCSPSAWRFTCSTGTAATTTPAANAIALLAFVPYILSALFLG